MPNVRYNSLRAEIARGVYRLLFFAAIGSVFLFIRAGEDRSSERNVLLVFASLAFVMCAIGLFSTVSEFRRIRSGRRS
jgi:hypothetical protein